MPYGTGPMVIPTETEPAYAGEAERRKPYSNPLFKPT